MKTIVKEIVIRGTRIVLSYEGLAGRPLFTVDVAGETVYGSLDRGAAAEAFGRECERASAPREGEAAR